MEKYMYYPLLDDKDKQLPLYLISVGHYPGQDPIAKPHGMPFHQLFLVADGNGVYTCGEKTYKLSPGICFFVPKDTTHEYYGTDAHFTTRWIAFDGNAAWDALSALGMTEACAFEGGLGSEFAHLQQSILALTKTKTSNAVLSAHVYSALVAFTTQYAPTQQGSSDALERACTHMSTNYTQPIALDTLAALADMSRFAFCRNFKKTYGHTPMEHLLMLRVQKAKQLLALHGNLSIRQIATQCGFSDAGYFIKCFKKIEHVTPLEFRKTRI